MVQKVTFSLLGCCPIDVECRFAWCTHRVPLCMLIGQTRGEVVL